MTQNLDIATTFRSWLSQHTIEGFQPPQEGWGNAIHSSLGPPRLVYKEREPMMKKDIRERIIEHIRRNAKDKEIYLDCMYGYVEHIHALVFLKAEQSISKIAQLLKGESSHWANEQRLTPMRFEWQDEYFAISVGESAVNEVREYIRNQEEHHRKKTFTEKYNEFLEEHNFLPRG